MEEKIPRVWVYLLILLILAVAVVLAGKILLRPKSGLSDATLSLEEKTRELEDKDRQIQESNIQIAQLQKELEESSKRAAELKSRLEQTAKALSSTEQRLKSAMRRAERSAAAKALPGKKTIPKPKEPASSGIWRRPADPGAYEVIRTTSVFEEPSAFSRKVSTIDKGTKVRVVGSVGEWLEVRSKHGNPPGFISRDAAMFIKKRRN